MSNPVVLMLVWWLASLALAIGVWPLLVGLFPFHRDHGYAIARAISGPVLAYVVLLLVAVGIIRNGAIAHIVSIALLAVCSVVISIRFVDWRSISKSLKSVLAIEFVFCLTFFMVAVIRSRNPEIEGLEKFMNFGFINSIYFAPTFPPPDPWFAGNPINYYYFGHMAAATMIRLTGVPLDVGYNLAFSQVLASFAAAMTSLALEMLVRLRSSRRRTLFPVAWFAGTLATFGGNMHSIMAGLIRPGLSSLGLVSASPYYFADSSRYIGFHPETSDKAFVEFPGYSVIVGDLHAHVMALPLVAVVHMLALAVSCNRSPIGSLPESAWRRKLSIGHAGLAAVVIGLDGMTNLWDLPIGITLLSLALLFNIFRSHISITNAALRSAGLVNALLLGALIVELPFWLAFKPFGNGVDLVRHATPLWQLFMLYGNYGIIIVVALAAQQYGVLARTRVGTHLHALLVFVLILIAIPETIYVRDIYGTEFARANTMFKTSYHLYVILPIIAVVYCVRLLATMQIVPLRTIITLAGASLLVPALVYPWFGIAHLLGTDPPLLRLNGLDFMSREGNGDLDARLFLLQHRPPPGAALLEASGDSYTYAGRMSATTGIPTVLGWQVHEWLWRSNSDEWRERSAEVSKFYQIETDADRREFISRFRIFYIVVGTQEFRAYPQLDLSALLHLGHPVFRAGDTTIIQVDQT